MVAHHLAKVRVASSNLVIRSSESFTVRRGPEVWGTAHLVAWPRGEAAACKAVHTGSNPVATSLTAADESLETGRRRAIGAAVARFPDTEEVAGSIPVSLTTKSPGIIEIPGLFCCPCKIRARMPSSVSDGFRDG